MLLTERNTQAIERRVRRAAVQKFGHPRFTAFFEHGQWWLDFADGAQYSVVDAVGGPAIDGFDFEQVTRGEED